MTIRYNSGDPSGLGIPSGYEGANEPSDFILPPCGIEDVDKALFDAFDHEIGFAVTNTKTSESTKVPTIFAAGEKWAMLKKGRALRDKTGALILPLITIRRVSIEQNVSEDIVGRGINQQTGELVIKRRLSTSDRSYQNLINKLGILNQSNISDGTNSLTTKRLTGQNSNDLDIQKGALLAPKLGNNIWEIITIPSPQFFSATYEITFWTQYTFHMNQIIQKLLSSYLPTANGTLKLDSPKGYWFIGTVVGNQFTSEDNADNMSDSERILRYKFSIKVAGYLVASDSPGVLPAARKFVSAPMVSFTFGDNQAEELTSGMPENKDPYEGADDPTQGFTLDGEVKTREHSRVTVTPTNEVKIIKNPFNNKDEKIYLRIVDKNVKNGEQILKPDDGFAFKIINK